jgi:hypothetical protein
LKLLTHGQQATGQLANSFLRPAVGHSQLVGKLRGLGELRMLVRQRAALGETRS